MTKLQSLNPSKNYELIGEVEMSYQADVKNAVLDAKSAQKMWSDLSIEQRCAHIKDFTDICEKHSADIAQLMILEGVILQHWTMYRAELIFLINILIPHQIFLNQKLHLKMKKRYIEYFKSHMV